MKLFSIVLYKIEYEFINMVDEFLEYFNSSKK